MKKLKGGCYEVRLVLAPDVVAFAETQWQKLGHLSVEDYLNAVLNTALGSAGAQAFAPNDDTTPGFVIIPDCGNPSHIYVDGWDTAGAAFNGFIEGIV